MKEGHIYLYYSPPLMTNERVTVAGKFLNGTLRIAVARCSKKDRFVRKIGRKIAENRLNKNFLYDYYVDKSFDINYFIQKAKEISNEVIETKKVIRDELKRKKKNVISYFSND